MTEKKKSRNAISHNGARVLGHGAYLPKKILTNADLAKKLDTSDEWIMQRTGIKSRHIAADNERTSDMATRAAEEALASAKISAKELDCVIVATTTPDRTFPSVAAQVQAKLGMEQGYGFDVQAVCSGFVYALTVADAMMRVGSDRFTLVVGADTLSRILDWEDRATCVLFGDGAGAILLRAPSEKEEEEKDGVKNGIIASSLHSDGRLMPLLYTDGGVSFNKSAGVIKMQGREVFRHAVVNISDAINKTLEKAEMTAEEIDWFVPHQANARILNAVADRLRLPSEKIVVTIEKHANTSAASVPLAIHEAVADGRVKKGDLLLLEAMGGGLTWGALLMRW